MDNVCNRRLFSIPCKVEMAEEQEYLVETTYDVITFLIWIMQKRKYLYKEKRYSQKENVILLYFEKPFK